MTACTPLRLRHLLLLAAFAAMGAGAAELRDEGPRLWVAGTLDTDSARALAERLAGGGIQVVVFQDSMGGSPQAAEAWARALRSASVRTEASGACHGACAVAFLAGRERRFARGLQISTLLIPLPARPRAEGAHAVLAEFSAASVADGWQPGQGLLFSGTPTLFGRVYNSYWCDGSQGSDLSRCERVSDIDPHQMGIFSP